MDSRILRFRSLGEKSTEKASDVTTFLTEYSSFILFHVFLYKMRKTLQQYAKNPNGQTG
jgi:hypothetical protein